MTQRKSITVETVINAPVEKVWECWSEPNHITKWCFASDDWEAPLAENDLRIGGRFKTRMAAKDGSAGFDFGGIYSVVNPHKLIEYVMDDGRKVTIRFQSGNGGTNVSETFEMEDENSEALQRAGWQSILDNFKKYVESN